MVQCDRILLQVKSHWSPALETDSMILFHQQSKTAKDVLLKNSRESKNATIPYNKRIF